MSGMNRVAVIGLGLMGGSLALALSRSGGWQVTGWDSSSEVRDQARQSLSGIQIAEDMEKAVAGATIVVLAVPVRAAIELKQRLFAALKPGTVLTDLSSTKGELEQEFERECPSDIAWVGGHPMAGSEKQGLAAAREDLFQGAVWFLCPGSSCLPAQLEKIIAMVRSTGAREYLLTAAEHDRLTARLSHLPHLVAGGLLHNIVASLGLEALSLAGPGLKDTTRIAGSQVTMWLDICLTNRVELCTALEDLQALLQEIKEALVHQDEDKLAEYLTEAKAFRENMK